MRKVTKGQVSFSLVIWLYVIIPVLHLQSLAVTDAAELAADVVFNWNLVTNVRCLTELDN